MGTFDRMLDTIVKQATQIGEQKSQIDKLNSTLSDTERSLYQAQRALEDKSKAQPDIVSWPQICAEIAGYANGGEKIRAIKRYREITGLGLREAKDFVELCWPNATCSRS